MLSVSSSNLPDVENRKASSRWWVWLQIKKIYVLNLNNGMILWITLWMSKRWGAGLSTTKLILSSVSNRIQQLLSHLTILEIKKTIWIPFNRYLSILLLLLMVIRTTRVIICWIIFKLKMLTKMSPLCIISLRRILNHIWLAINSRLEALPFQIPQLRIRMSTILLTCPLSRRLQKDIWPRRVGLIRYLDKVRSSNFQMRLYLFPLNQAWETSNSLLVSIIIFSICYLSLVVTPQKILLALILIIRTPSSS